MLLLNVFFADDVGFGCEVPNSVEDLKFDDVCNTLRRFPFSLILVTVWS